MQTPGTAREIFEYIEDKNNQSLKIRRGIQGLKL